MPAAVESGIRSSQTGLAFSQTGLAFSRPDVLNVSKACGFIGQQTCCPVAGDTDGGGESGFNPVGTVTEGF